MVDIGVQIHPQHGTAAATLGAWQAADELGFASIWTWDHVSPLKAGASHASHEAWTLLAAAALKTSRARIGVLVTCAPLRSPELIADMARTVNDISGGRLVLGLGAGWRQEDYATYGIAFPTVPERVVALRRACGRIRARLSATGADGIPILVGGNRAVLSAAAACEAWNFIGSPVMFGQLNQELDDQCRQAGRQPAAVRRTILLRPSDEDDAPSYAAQGADELILGWPAPFDIGALLQRRASAKAGG